MAANQKIQKIPSKEMPPTPAKNPNQQHQPPPPHQPNLTPTPKPKFKTPSAM